MNAPRRRFLGELTLAFRYALRDLKGDARGFAVFIACIVIGVAATSGVGGLSRSLAQGLAREGRVILGGDIALTQVLRDFTPEEHAGLEKRGRLDTIGMMRAMARRDDGDTALIELKAVDPLTYPAFGVLAIEPEVSLADALAEKSGAFGIIADPLLIARLEMKIGDVLTIGNARFALRAALRNEPDKLAGGVSFGPRVLIGLDALRASGPRAAGRHCALHRASWPPQRRQRRRSRARRRRGGGRVSAGGLGSAQTRWRVAADFAQSGTLRTVADAGRPHRARRRRRRRRQRRRWTRRSASAAPCEF